jgi:hypothetical protein
MSAFISLFGWLVADGWCWFVLREQYCWLVAGGWFVLREKYCWLVADKPNEQAAYRRSRLRVPAGNKNTYAEGMNELTSHNYYYSYMPRSWSNPTAHESQLSMS